ncbi:MAG: histidine kinase [Eubacterium sp.]|nr:histidine kinase [Eubacterium sp.]
MCIVTLPGYLFTCWKCAALLRGADSVLVELVGLASIYLLCREDPEKAATVVNDFTEYLQGNFTAISETNLVSFSEELRHTQAYLAVEKALYMDKLQVEQDTDFKAFRLPPLTLQPLVENATDLSPCPSG